MKPDSVPHRGSSQARVLVSLLGLSLLGVAINIFYFNTVIASWDAVQAMPFVDAALTPVVALFIYLYGRSDRAFAEAVRKIREDGSASADLLKRAAHAVHMRPRSVSRLIALLWVLGSALIVAPLYWTGLIQLFDALNAFLFASLITNPIVVILSYFMTEILSRKDLKFLATDHEEPAITLSIRFKLLFTMIFLSALMLALLAGVALSNMREMMGTLSWHHAHFISIIATGGIGIFYSGAAALMLSQTIMSPLSDLLMAMKRVGSGELDTHIPVTSTDEIALLTAGFNQMTRGLKDRERIREVFGSYVSAEVRDEILGGNIELGGQEVEASILFADIRNFTTLCENHTAPQIVVMLNQYFTEMVRAITTNGGTVNKFIGDAVMAVFGAPVPYADHASRALLASGQMIERLKAHNALQEVKGEPTFDIGIGIHTGLVIAGNIGSAERKEYTVIGDTVNAASRIEGMTKQLHKTILFSEATFKRAARGEFVAEVTVKGKEEKLRLYSFETEDGEATSGIISGRE